MLPKDAAPIIALPPESGEDVVYVSGAEGVIATTFMAEDLDQIPGENNPKPVCILVELVTPTDSYMPKVITPH